MKKNIRLIRINGNLNNLSEVLQLLVDVNCIDLIPSKQLINEGDRLSTVPTDNPWRIVYKELEDIETESNKFILPCDIKTIDDKLVKVKKYIHTTHEKLHKLAIDRKETEELINKYQNALIEIKNINKLDVSLDDIFSCEYIKTRFGKLPLDSLELLKIYENKPYIFNSFNEEKNYVWCMYLTTAKHEKEIDNIFSSLFFERVYIPDFIHGTPDDAQTALKKEIDLVSQSLVAIKESINTILNENQERLAHIKGELLLLDKIYEAKKYVISLGDRYVITGFIHKKDVDLFVERFKGQKELNIDVVPADLDKRVKVPKKIKNKCND